MCEDQDLQDQIEEVESDLAAVRAAILKILGGAQSYTLDTSQSREVVTRADLSSLRIMRNELRAELSSLKAQCSGGGVNVIPGF